MGKEPYLRGLLEHFSCEKSKAKKYRQLADEEKAGRNTRSVAAGIASQRIHDTDCTESMMKKGFNASKNGTWEKRKETFKKKMRTSEWGFDRIKEAFDLVAKDGAEKMSIVQEIMLKSTDHVRQIIAPVGGQGSVTMSYLCPNCNSFTLEDYVWWVFAGIKYTI